MSGLPTSVAPSVLPEPRGDALWSRWDPLLPGTRASLVTARLGGPQRGPGPPPQLLGHLPVFQLSDQLIHGVGVVVREGSPRVWGELTDGIVYQDPIQDAGSFSRSEPPPYQPSVLGDLRAHRASHVEPPDMEALGSGSEAMTIIGQDGLLQGRVLAGVLRRQVLAGLLGRSGKKGRQDVRPLVLRPLLPSGLSNTSKYASTSSSGPSLVRRLVGAAVGASRPACWVSLITASRRRARLSAVSRCCRCAAAPSGFCIWVGLVIPCNP